MSSAFSAGPSHHGYHTVSSSSEMDPAMSPSAMNRRPEDDDESGLGSSSDSMGSTTLGISGGSMGGQTGGHGGGHLDGGPYLYATQQHPPHSMGGDMMRPR